MLKLKYFRYKLHSLLYMFNYFKDKQSYCIIKVIFIAVVNPSTTTIHRPGENLHLTKKSQSDLFPPILMHQKTIYWSYTEKIRERKRLTSWTCYLQGVYNVIFTESKKKFEKKNIIYVIFLKIRIAFFSLVFKDFRTFRGKC